MEDTLISIDDNITHNGKQEKFILHDREQVTMITCSPNMKNIVTWSDKDKSAVCWCAFDNQQTLEPKHKISLENNKKHKNYDKYFVYSKRKKSELSKNFGDIRNYLTVSDDKFVSMPIEEVDLEIKYISKTVEKDEMKVVSEIKKKSVKRIKVGIFNFENGENLFLSLPCSEIIVKSLAFLDGNKLIMIRSITKWDINTSKFEAYFLFDNSFDIDNMKLSDNGVLLFVYGRKRVDNWYKDPYPCISVYFADHGNKFATFKHHDKTVIIDAVYLIASDIGARLLIVHHKKNEEAKKYQYHLCDPFVLNVPEKSEKNYVEANELFKDFEAKCDEIFENKYIIKDDKIVGFNNDGKLVIQGLIPVNWISYLRGTLKDSNSVFISSVSEKIIELIVKSKKTTEEATFDIKKKPQYSKYFVTWTLKHIKNNIILTAEFKNDKIEQTETKSDEQAETKSDEQAETKSDEQAKIKPDSIQIVPAIYINSGKEVEKFVQECDCLDDDDLVMVTALGVLIWTFNTKDSKIELNYHWDDEGDYWNWDRIKVINLFYEIDEKTFDEKTFDEMTFDEEIFYIKALKKISYFLPPSSYISMIRYHHVFSQSHLQPPKDNRLFFNELIERRINNKFFLILYGKKLIEDIIKEDEDMLLRKLFNGCIEQIEKDEETLNTQIFKIFSQSITEISEKNPSFFEEFVIKISLLCVLKVEKKDRILKHLNHYQNYSSLSELTNLESLFDTIYNSFLYKKLTTSNIYIYIINSCPYKKIISKFKPCRTPQLFLMFPLPNFVTYYENEDEDSFLEKLFRPRSSHFIDMDDLIFYKSWNGEALINFKWNAFGRKYYFTIWMIYIVFFGSFTIVATLSTFISWPCQKILLITTTVLGFWHLQVEVRKITLSYKNYIRSLWNCLDLGTILSAIVTSIIWLRNGSVSIGAITFTTLLLELKFILYLRFKEYFGIYLAMIMNTADKVIAFLILFGLIIFAFAHSLHLLLRSEIFQDSGINMFIQFGSSILAAYYMMVTGDSTPVSSILGNLLEDDKDHHLAYLKLKKEILEKIELFYLLPSQKKNYKWFPYTFYYSVHISELRKFISDINSSDWKESTKPIITKIMKLIREEKQESDADKIHKIYEKQESDADKIHKIYEKQELEANKIHKIYEKQESEADKIQEIYEKQKSEADKIQKIYEKQESEANKIQEIYEKQENFQKLLEKIMKKLEIQSSEENDD
ncbi:transient receptor potential cation channel subfamily a member 1-like [Gigaspora margarita]|uniref:Transient receptor potential cation channel subfamily a member 1-like n=1 Tax=Gigaspora margarita TaxID=4874 RepID=A0A8H3X768_GIGMA|nr:transient receptor potential cation channel subfamily a member 1-like [Gigaspora margarita]